MKKNNTAQKTVFEAQEISKALKEGTEKALHGLLNEAINQVITESVEDEEPKDEDEFTEEDVETNEEPQTDETEEGGEDAPVEDAPEEGASEEGDETVPEEEDAEDEAGDGNEWSEYEDYKVGDNDYDFTGMNGDEILKVYNKLGDDDKIFVKKEDDGTYDVKDEETGAEFVIELDADALDNEEGESFEEPESDEEEAEFEITPDEDSEGIDAEGEEESPEFGDDDIDIEIVPDEEGDEDDEERLDETELGYTDSYQKDVFAKKLNMNEPANSSATYSMDAGAPKGNTKPWAGKGNMKPFGQKKDELDEAGHANSKATNRTTARTIKHHDTDDEYNRSFSRNPDKRVGTAKQNLEEAYKNLLAKAKQLQVENKQLHGALNEYKKSIKSMKNSICEAAISNVTLAQVVKLLSENTTTKKEKASIVERFSNVKTLKESKELYNTISHELNEGSNNRTVMLEKQLSADSNRILNENSIYQNESNPALSLMYRMDNLPKSR